MDSSNEKFAGMSTINEDRNYPLDRLAAMAKGGMDHRQGIVRQRF